MDRMFYGSLQSRPQTASYPPRGEVQPAVDVPLSALPSLRSYRENLQYLMRMCATDGCRVLLSTQAPIYDRPGAPEAMGRVTNKAMRRTCFQTASGAYITERSPAAAMDAVRQATLSIAEQAGAAIADPQRAIDGHVEYFLDDFHANPQGSAVIARSIAAALTPILDAVRTQRTINADRHTPPPSDASGQVTNQSGLFRNGPGQVNNHPGKAGSHPGQTGVVKLVGRVIGAVIMRIAEWGGVGNHHCLEPLLPE